MTYIKFFIYLLLFIIIYSISFYNLGNTLLRIDSSNNLIFRISPLFTEGFIGPLRTLYIMIITFNYKGFFYLLYIFLTNSWSPYAVMLWLVIIDFILKIKIY